MKRLAHLNALRAFEISARAGSFAKAAEELCVTPAAVSQQVRLLEGYLGVALFHRHGSRLGPTDAAEHMLPDIAHGFERLARGIQKAAGPRRRASQVQVTAPPAFVAKWLIPRLEVFRAEHPHIYLHIGCADGSGTHQENVDLQVVESAEWSDPSPNSWPLFTDDLFPVCSPKLQMQLDTRRGFQQLRECILIHDNGFEAGTTCAEWDRLLQSLKLPLSNSKTSIGFGDSLAATLAAREGLGVLLGRHFVVDEDLRTGSLVRPFDSIQMQGPTYKAVLVDPAKPRDEIVVLRNWLVAQAKAYRERYAGAGEVANPGACEPLTTPARHAFPATSQRQPDAYAGRTLAP